MSGYGEVLTDVGSISVQVEFESNDSNRPHPDPITVILEVTKRPVLIIADDVTVQYGNEPVLGWHYADDSLEFIDVPAGITLDVSGDVTGIGYYPISLSVSVADNYDKTTSGGTLHVMPRQATVTIDDKSSVYGDPLQAPTAEDTSLKTI